MSDNKNQVFRDIDDDGFISSLLKINSDLKLEAALKNVLSSLTTLFKCEMASVVLSDLRNNVLKLYTLFDGSDHHDIKPHTYSDALIGWRSANRGPVIANDLESDIQFQELAGGYYRNKPKNLISVPLFAEGEFFGMVQAANSQRPEGFSQEELATLSALGNHVAVALRNSWFLEDAKRGSREARSLYEVGIALSATLELDDLLEKILDNLRRVVSYNSAMIYLISPSGKVIHDIVSRGVPEAMRDSLPMRIGQGITGRVVQTGQCHNCIRCYPKS